MLAESRDELGISQETGIEFACVCVYMGMGVISLFLQSHLDSVRGLHSLEWILMCETLDHTPVISRPWQGQL